MHPTSWTATFRKARCYACVFLRRFPHCDPYVLHHAPSRRPYGKHSPSLSVVEQSRDLWLCKKGSHAWWISFLKKGKTPIIGKRCKYLRYKKVNDIKNTK